VNRTDAAAPAPLSVTTADLTLTVDGTQLPIKSAGDRLFLEVPTVRAALRLVRGLPADADATGVTKLLLATDLAFEVRVRGRTVAVVGTTARPGPLARWLDVSPAEPRLAGVISAGWDGLSAAVDSITQFGR